MPRLASRPVSASHSDCSSPRVRSTYLYLSTFIQLSRNRCIEISSAKIYFVARGCVVGVPLNTASVPHRRCTLPVLRYPLRMFNHPPPGLFVVASCPISFFIFRSGSVLSQSPNNYRLRGPAISTLFECGCIRASAPFRYLSYPCASQLGGKAVPFRIRSPFTSLLTLFISVPYLVAKFDHRSVLRLSCPVRLLSHLAGFQCCYFIDPSSCCWPICRRPASGQF